MRIAVTLSGFLLAVAALTRLGHGSEVPQLSPVDAIAVVSAAYQENYGKLANARLKIEVSIVSDGGGSGGAVKLRRQLELQDDQMRCDEYNDQGTLVQQLLYNGAHWTRYTPNTGKLELVPDSGLVASPPVDPRNYGSPSIKLPFAELLRQLNWRAAEFSGDNSQDIAIDAIDAIGSEEVRTRYIFSADSGLLLTKVERSLNGSLTKSIEVDYAQVSEEKLLFPRRQLVTWYGERHGGVASDWHQRMQHEVLILAVNESGFELDGSIDVPDGTYVEDQINERIYRAGPKPQLVADVAGSGRSFYVLGSIAFLALLVLILIVRQRKLSQS